MIPFESLSRGLRTATLLFLALPLMIFFGGWLRWPLALVVCGALAAGLRPRAHPEEGSTVPAGVDPAAIRWWWLLLLVVLPAALLTALSGAGGWGAGDSDWLKHDTILRDLLERTWPVTYDSGQGPVLLVYYLNFYLPAALAGKLAGGSWSVASQGLALTTWLGLALAGGWMVALAGAARRPGNAASPVRVVGAAAAVFVGFSGLEVLGKVGVNVFLRLPWFHGDWNDIEWWAQFAQYSANAATVFWAPQHAFGGWLPVALVLDDWFRHRDPARRGVLYVALALAWSPFAAVGLLPIVLALSLWRRPGETRRRPIETLRRFVSLENAAGVLAGGMFSLYLLAHFQAYYIPAQYRVTPGFQPMPLLGLVPFAVLYLAFVCVQFAGLSVALWIGFGEKAAGDPTPRAEGPLLCVATGMLLLLPWFRYGYANDLVMRGGLPALFTLQVLLVRLGTPAAGERTRRRWLAAALAAVLLTGGLANTFLEYRRHVVRMLAQGSWRDARTAEPVRTLAELHRTVYARPNFDFTRQYLGSAESAFVRYAAARRGALRPGAPAGTKPDF